MNWLKILKQIDDNRWELPQDYKPGMRVPGLIFADEAMLDDYLAVLGAGGDTVLRGYLADSLRFAAYKKLQPSTE